MKRQAILDGLAEVLEAEKVTPATVLASVGQWDSLAVVCTIALLDEQLGVQVDGPSLAKCETAADVLRLAGIEAAA